MKAKFQQVLERSVAAAVSAIEIYNKPDFKYRSETFSILMTNAWELVLKAKILKDNRNDLRSIQRKERRRLKDGNLSKGLYFRRTRSNNPETLSIGEAAKRIRKTNSLDLDHRVIENLNLLVEVRDNAIHLVNKDLGLQTRIQDIGAAAVKNYVQVVQEWFDYSLTRYNFYLMPLSFFHEADVIQSFSLASYNEQTRNFLKYLESVEQEYPSHAESVYNATLRVETKFLRSSSDNSIHKVQTTNDPTAPKVQITEEDMLKKYPYDYSSLSEKLRRRYVDFKQNRRYHGILKPLKADPKYCRVRLLNPSKPESSRKEYYSSEVFKVFDNHYRKTTR